MTAVGDLINRYQPRTDRAVLAERSDLAEGLWHRMEHVKLTGLPSLRAVLGLVEGLQADWAVVVEAIRADLDVEQTPSATLLLDIACAGRERPTPSQEALLTGWLWMYRDDVKERLDAQYGPRVTVQHWPGEALDE